MERFELFTVELTWAVRNDMLILHPAFSVPVGGWKTSSEMVTVLRPDGVQIEATAEISMSHLNIPNPDVSIERRWCVTMWLTDRTAAEVPVGSKILTSRVTRDILLAAGQY